MNYPSTQLKILILIFSIFIASCKTSNPATGPNESKSNYPPEGLVALWQFNNTAIDTINNRYANLYGTLRFDSGYVKNCITLNGLNSACSVDDSSVYNFKSSFSISVWTKLPTSIKSFPPGWQNAFPFIIQKGDDYRYRNYGLYFSRDAGSLAFDAGDSSQGFVFQINWKGADSVFNDLRWHHIIAVWNRANVTASLYIDGHLVASVIGQNKNLNLVKEKIFIGSSSQGLYYLKGSLDDLALFSRALTSDEVSQIYNSGAKGILF